MSEFYRAASAAELWRHAIDGLLETGHAVSPRDQETVERTGVIYELSNPRANIIISNARNLNYQFMVAEWLWMAYGRDDVNTIAQYNSQIAKFSDDGITFNGNYGVPIARQMPYVMDKLRSDTASRQAIIQIYSQPMRPTKDVPCTLSLQFILRGFYLQMLVAMRSSDVWLGLPYDIFNFTQIGEGVAAKLRQCIDPRIHFNKMLLTLGSSHLYERNREGAEAVMLEWPRGHTSPVLPEWPPVWLEEILVTCRSSKYEPPQPRKGAPIHLGMPWLEYGNALLAESWSDALTILASL